MKRKSETKKTRSDKKVKAARSRKKRSAIFRLTTRTGRARMPACL